jgi:Skp family chaperone for outer membrane proteins
LSRKYVVIAAGVVVLIALAALGYYFWGTGSESPQVVATASQPAAQPSVHAASGDGLPVIAVIDRDAILQRSKVGQDIARQVRALADQARTKLSARRQALESQSAALEKQAASLSPDDRQKRALALQAEQVSFQQDVQREDARIQGALRQANMQVAKAMAPILEQVVKEHGANMVLDKRAVIAASDPAFDISDEIISRLDAKLTSVAVAAPPPAQ